MLLLTASKHLVISSLQKKVIEVANYYKMARGGLLPYLEWIQSINNLDTRMYLVSPTALIGDLF